MKRDEKINYLNYALNQKEDFVYYGPVFLYKYRPFDQYSFDMLENEYLFLCRALDLDDETECNTTIDVSDLYDFKTNNLKRLCLDKIIQILEPHCSKEIYEELRTKIYQITLENGVVRRHYLLDLSHEIQEAAPNVDTAPLINWIANIPEKLDEPNVRCQVEKLMRIAISAKEIVGICSLSENNDIDYMWEKYADKKRGYCIEYDFSKYEHQRDVVPVVYDANRETNIALSIVGDFINQMIAGFSGGQIQTDASKFLRLFTSKYPEWEYQNEWRIIGSANTKCKAPKISKIIVGQHSSKDNIERMTMFCKKHNIKLEKL